jgi:hypothetical protein
LSGSERSVVLVNQRSQRVRDLPTCRIAVIIRED